MTNSPISNTGCILFLSPFGAGKTSGHVLQDDHFYYSAFAHNGHRCHFMLRYYSYNNIIQAANPGEVSLSYITTAELLFWLFHYRSIRKIIFLGFREIHLLITLPFLALSLLTLHRISLSLVCTNNLGIRRVKSNRIKLIVLYYMLSPWLSSIVVHTRSEKRFFSRVAPFVSTRIKQKIHHSFLCIN
jgi:hypothetical protein